MAVSYDLDDLTLIRVSDGWQLDIRPLLSDAGLSFTGAIDTAPTWTATVADPEGEVLNAHRFIKRSGGPEFEPFFKTDASGRLVKIDCRIRGRWYRLQGISVDADTLTLTLEDRLVARLRSKYGHRVASRNDVTRAQFSESLVKALKSERVDFYSRDLTVKQPIAKGQPADSSSDSKDTDNSDAKLSGGPKTFSSNQQVFAEACASECGLDVRVIAAWMMREFGGAEKTTRNNYNFMSVGFTDSGDTAQSQKDVFGKPASAGKYTGQFLKGDTTPKSSQQIQDITKTAGKPIEDQVRAIIDSNWASSHYNRDYSGFTALARSFKASGDSSVETVDVSYQYEVKQDEDYWTALGRLADEVLWRCFVHQRQGSPEVVYFMSDYQLLRSKVQYTFQPSRREHTAGPSFDWDNTQVFPQQFTVTVLIDPEALAPGDVVDAVELGPANGRWLVQEVSYSYFSPGVSLTLIQPVVPKKEPPHEEAQKNDEDEAKAPGDGKSGQWTLGQGANRAGVGLKQPIEDFLTELAGNTNEAVVVTTGTNHNQMTTSGNVSDHWDGNAADIGVPVDSPKGDNIAAAALIVCGVKRAQAEEMARTGQGLDFSRDYTWKGHRVQIGWRTNVGGNHHNHVHVGVK
jgi:hypothetical protein